MIDPISDFYFEHQLAGEFSRDKHKELIAEVNKHGVKFRVMNYKKEVYRGDSFEVAADTYNNLYN